MRLASSSHSSGRRLNSRVSMIVCSMPAANMHRWKPISPMSWVSGIQLRDTSRSVNRPRSMIAPMLVIRFRCVSTTPLGVLVEPEENWMKATSSAVTGCSIPGREMSVTRSTVSERRTSSSTCAVVALAFA